MIACSDRRLGSRKLGTYAAVVADPQPAKGPDASSTVHDVYGQLS
jgi:hypothetical protein